MMNILISINSMENKLLDVKDSYFEKLLLVASIGTALANAVEADLGCTSRVYFDNVTLLSQKPCQYNNKFDCSESKGYNIPQEAINEV